MPRRSRGIVSVVRLLCVLVSIAFAQNGWAQSPTSWQLIWSDEFNGAAGSAPNPAYWTLQQGLTQDGAQSYNCLYGQTTNGCDPNNPNVYLDGNGNLAIVGRSAPGAPNGITSGRLTTTAGVNNSTILFGTQYGRIEAGMTLPVNAGNQGVWPAFWMMGTNISEINWPACGEIDIMEYVGAAHPDTIFSTLHGEGYSNNGLGVTANNNAGWGGYHIFGAIWSPNEVQFYIDDIANIVGTISTADIRANQSWVNGGLSAWPFNNPFFLLLDLNMGGPFPGNVSGSTTYPQTLLVDYVRVYQAAAPGAPTNLTATAASQSQVTLNWTASTNSDATYNVYRSTVSGAAPQSQAQPNPAVFPQTNATLIASDVAGTTYTDANLSPGQTYYYRVTSSGGYSGESAAPQVQVTMPASGVGANGGALSVSAAGYSGTGSYIQNSLVSGGFINAFTAAVNTSGVTNPAPQDVYHTERWGAQSWTIAHLSPGGSYNLRLHFAESTWTASGQRQFNVLVNGQQVLSNFDIYATAGAQNTVVTQTINTLADSNGVILLQLAVGASDQPEIRALDVTQSTGGVAMGQAAGTSTYVGIDAGGPTEGQFDQFLEDDNVGDFALPQDPFTFGGATDSTEQVVGTTGVADPAPEAVYQTERYGALGYTFTGLLPSSAYTLRLHFAETTPNYTAPGDRVFQVAVNGTLVLSNYDIFARAGGANQAVIQDVQGTSDQYGMLSLQLIPGSAYLPSVRGVELVWSGAAGISGTAPPPPTALTATAVSGSQINLSWTASTTSGVEYEVFRSTSSGFTPSSTNLISTTANTTFTDSGLTVDTTYYYVVEASGSSGTSVPSRQASAITPAADALDINAGGAASGAYAGDEYFSGGMTASTTAAIDTSLVTNPAPQAVYQTNRYGTFRYTIPNLTPNANYIVNLHFAEVYWTAAGKREFNVLINGATGLANFDIFAAAGGENIAIVKSFPAVASTSGTITIQFTPGAADQPEVSAIEIIQGASNTPNFGPNVFIVDPSMSSAQVTQLMTSISNEDQFAVNRWAVLFMPGTYNVQAPVGYYESIAGLGETPSAVTINGFLTPNFGNTYPGANVTDTFWRSMENMAFNPVTNSAQNGPANTLQWGVSQAAPLRRVQINGGLELTDSYCGFASGGFISDSVVTGNVNPCSQQQWYTRNSSLGSWNGGVWNMVFSGVSGAPAPSFPNPPETVLPETPVSREKPFLYVDGSGNFNVFVPTVQTNSSGTTWSGGGLGVGYSLPISSFYIAQPSNTAAQINAALAAGLNLILTPGVYQLAGPINVTNANTIVLGLGYATLIPQNGTAAITVADVDGVQVAGLIVDAGPNNSPVLVEVGNPGGSAVSHAANPTSINDVTFRIGGAEAGSATTSLQVDSNNVILDNIWAWRADHGNGVGWTSNTAAHGVVINGNNVTALGLAVEHYQQAQTVWNGNGGETIFYQSELPYDPPSQSAWMDGTANGYPSYYVSPAVTSHVAYGLGVYSFFNQGVNIVEDSAISVPNVAGVTLNDLLSVFLNGSGQITYVADNAGTVANLADDGQPQDLAIYGGQSCTTAGTACPVVPLPAAPDNLTATAASSSQINLVWGTNGNAAVTYSVFRSTTSGFTPGTANQVATGLMTTVYSDTGLAAGTTYYYAVEAVNTAGASGASNQASATTVSNGPAAPTNLSATAASSSQVNLTWTASTTSGVTYKVFRGVTSGFAPGPESQIATGLTATSYSDNGVSAATTYYYAVEATDAAGTSAASNQASVITPSLCSPACADVLDINSGGTTTGAYVSDEDFTGGSASSTAATINTSLVSDPAPQAAYQTERFGDFTYTLPNLTPGGSYVVNLHFAEIYWPAAGQRQFNVLINGATVLSNFDIVAAAGGKDIAIVKSFPATASSAGTITIQFTTGAADLPKVSGIQLQQVTNAPPPTDIQIDAGGGASGTWLSDEYFTGGSASSTTAAINTSLVTNPAPQSVYQTERYSDFTYTIPGLTPGTTYNVNLHFAEIYWNGPGKREFNVLINGSTVLTNFDIFAAAGGEDIAIVKTYQATASSNGTITIQFTTGAADLPKVSGIEVVSR